MTQSIFARSLKIGTSRVTGSPLKIIAIFQPIIAISNPVVLESMFSAQAFYSPAAPYLAVVDFSLEKKSRCAWLNAFDVALRIPAQSYQELAVHASTMWHRSI